MAIKIEKSVVFHWIALLVSYLVLTPVVVGQDCPLVSGDALAAEWKSISSNEDGSILYLGG